MFGVYRFILAVNVVIYHVLDVASIGPYAVYSFFVLSGFLMTMIMNESYGYSLDGFKRYALNRFLRLYPVYWCLLLLGICIILLIGNEVSGVFHAKMILPNDFASAIANVTMIYPAFEPVTYPVRISPATWALSIEILFYVLIGLGISRTRMITLIWLFASMCWVGGNMFQTGSFSTGYGNVLQAALPFSLGAWVYHYRKWVTSVVYKIGMPLIVCLYIGNIAIVVLCQVLIADKAWFVSLIGSWLNLGLSTLMTVLLFEQGSRFFSKKVDRVLGDLSFPIYLFHWSGAALASWLITEDMSKGALVFTLGLLITVIISVLVNIYVNESIERIRARIRQG
ncbi:acyltransferase family protein [Paraglaciecola chathamensis]|uniref:Acyltransferase 3 n=1 Tax=Paraglaciecola chathamensis S18K6 TaxID=1127672 RepID=A0AAV3V1J4_9ALTE|nr:acyltransferase [Paraglaciecola chathamensis]GAC10820.1 acyltransferase 3 [Paraglaciecola chathamensis S18K6]